MELFAIENQQNRLPYDGCANYYGPIITPLEADDYFNILMSQINWEYDEAIIFGKRIITKRKVAWYGDSPYSYTYSKVTKHALPWTPTLKVIKALIEEKAKSEFNSCLLNLYHSGSEGMGWHSDGEKELVKHGVIASMSFGAERKFVFKHIRTKKQYHLSPIGKFVDDGESNTGSLAASITTYKKGYYASYKFNIPSNEIIK